jgi:ubiquitin thioesterase protein OTUB1
MATASTEVSLFSYLQLVEAERWKALAYAYVEHILTSEDKALAAVTAISTLHSTKSILDTAGYQDIVYEDFYDVFAKMLQDIATPQNSRSELTPQMLVQAFQNYESALCP